MLLTYKTTVLIDFILRPIRRNFGKDKRFYAAVDDMFGFIPNNIELYKLALIHKSASIVLADGQHINNERLEFLGDAVLESVSSDYLFIEFPDKNEGFLTKLRSKMVSRQMLNDVAKRIGLSDYVITHSSNNVSQKHIYGDAFEAMMGAIYLDQGYDFVNRLLINKIFVDYIKVDQLTQAETDFKSRLIEWCQKNHHTIHFDTENDKTYSSTHPFFYSKVMIDGIEMGYGAGESKKEAEQRAAYSVSQGFSDEDCTKLLDKLDLLDAKSRAHSMRQYKAASEPNETQEAQSVESVRSAGRAERAKGIEPSGSVVSEQSEKKKIEPKVYAKREVAAEQKPKPKAEPKAEPKSEPKAETTSEPKSETKPKAKPRSKTKPKAKQEAELKVESVEEISTVEKTIDEVDAQTESVAKKPRRRASSRAKSAKPKVATEPAAATTTATTTEPPIALATTIAPIAEITEKQSVEVSDNQSAGDVVAKEEIVATTPPKAKRSVRRRPKKADQKTEQKTEQNAE